MSEPYQPTGTETLTRLWRLKLAEAQRRYGDERTAENRAALLRALAAFTALVTRGEVPRQSDDAARSRP